MIGKGLKCKFGVPHHGWLTVEVTKGDFHLEMDSSDVPVDPVQHLVLALYKILKGIDSEVWWNLEPAGYYWYFTKLEDNRYQIKITFQECSDSPEKQTELLTGTKQEIIMPLWGALKEFYSHSYEEPHWPVSDDRELKKLSEIITLVN
ncbi:MAG: hypothetical protein NE327_21730 [Lentisphaeraceae bacterium]|nr:hypothetical protein [Lentisphaeraceae bacterium]